MVGDAHEADAMPAADLARWLEQVVQDAGGPAKAARLLDVARTTLDQWIKGKARIPLEPALKLAHHTGVSIDALFKKFRGDKDGLTAELVARGMIRPVDHNSLVAAQTQELSSSKLDDDFIRVPVLRVSAAAGRGRFPTPDDLTHGEMVAFRGVWLRTLGLSPGHVHILWAVGDSMEPTINDGDMMLVDRMTDHVLDGGIYVVVVGGAVVVKRLQTRLNGSVVLKSDNARYAEEVVPPDEVPSLIVEGRVRWVGGPI